MRKTSPSSVRHLLLPVLAVALAPPEATAAQIEDPLLPFLTDLGPHVSTFRASADATPNRSVEEDARQLPPLNITVGWSIQGYITATVNDELKKIFVYEDELTPREIAEKFVERHGLAGDDPAAALVAAAGRFAMCLAPMRRWGVAHAFPSRLREGGGGVALGGVRASRGLSNG